ncbi:MAG TPA: hydroxyacid dehydrogenase [Armatimonadota bacterium]
MKLLYAVKQDWYPRIFAENSVKRIGAATEVLDVPIPEEADKRFLLENSKDAEIIITCWNTEPIDADVMAVAPNLKLVVHAAGSVKPVVSDALWDAGVRVVGCAEALAYGVAEFCLGLIITAPKRVFWGVQGTREGKWRDGLEVFGGPFEIFGQKIGVIGAGNVGRVLMGLLKNLGCDVLIFDPYCTVERAKELGVTKVETLDELFAQCRVISVNAPSTDETKEMIRGRHFALLQDGAVFINTARSSIICESEMIEELRKERFIACLDVTDPEPAPENHPFRSMPNVLLTPHEAGAIAENRLRIGQFAANALEEFVSGQPLRNEITRELLSRVG